MIEGERVLVMCGRAVTVESLQTNMNLQMVLIKHQGAQIRFCISSDDVFGTLCTHPFVSKHPKSEQTDIKLLLCDIKYT